MCDRFTHHPSEPTSSTPRPLSTLNRIASFPACNIGASSSSSNTPASVYAKSLPAAAHQIHLRAQAEIDGARLMASLAFDGFGAAIVPAPAIPTWLTGSFRLVQVPGLPRRVVASVRRRRPSASASTLATLNTLHTVVEEQGEEQQGVHLDTAAPFGPRG